MRPEIKTTGLEAVEEFLLTRDFEFLGLDWVIVISIPGGTVLADINANVFTRLFLILGTTGGMKLASALLLAGIISCCGGCVAEAQVVDLPAPPDSEPAMLGRSSTTIFGDTMVVVADQNA